MKPFFNLILVLSAAAASSAGCARKTSDSHLAAAGSGGFKDNCMTYQQKTEGQALTEAEKTVAALLKLYRSRASIEPNKPVDCNTAFSELDNMYLTYQNNDPTGLGFVKRIDLTNEDISDLGPISSFKNVQELWLSRNRITNLAPIANFTKLTFLDLSYNQVAQLSQIAASTGMRYLDVSHNQIKSLTGIDEMTKLQGLQASDNALKDIDSLTDLTSAPLAYVNLDRNAEIPEASLTKSLKKFAQTLEVVSLEGITGLADASFFANFQRLSTLTLKGTSVRDLAFAKDVSTLSVLDVSLTGVDDGAMGQLGGTGLEALFASENPALTGAGVTAEALPSLKVLSLAGTKTRDAKAIGKVPGLTVLDLTGTATERESFEQTYSLKVAYLPDVEEEGKCPVLPVDVCRLGKGGESSAYRMLATVSYAFLDPYLASNVDPE